MIFTSEIIGQEAIRLRLQHLPERVRDELVKAMQVCTIELSNTIKDSVADGASGLHVRTNTLRSSISPRTTSTSTSVVGTVGTKVKYARYHEYGLHKIVHVKAFLRRTAWQANPRSGNYGKQMTLRSAGKSKTSLVSSGMVRAHDRNVNYGGHPFMRPALALKSSWIVMTLRSAISRAMEGKP